MCFPCTCFRLRSCAEIGKPADKRALRRASHSTIGAARRRDLGLSWISCRRAIATITEAGGNEANRAFPILLRRIEAGLLKSSVRLYETITYDHGEVVERGAEWSAVNAASFANYALNSYDDSRYNLRPDDLIGGDFGYSLGLDPSEGIGDNVSVKIVGLLFDEEEIKQLAGNLTILSINEVATDKKGRPPDYDWEAALAHLVAMANGINGLFPNDEKQTVAYICGLMSDYFEEAQGRRPSESMLKEKATTVKAALDRTAGK